MIYDDTCEVVEIPSKEWIKLAELNIQNKDVIRQREIREQLRSMNGMEVKFDQYFFDKTEHKNNEIEIVIEEKESILENKNKDNDEETSNSLKLGTLKAHSISTLNEMSHGFKIYMENVIDDETKETEPDIVFDTKEIYLNKRNFTNSNLNILLQMNLFNQKNHDSEQYNHENNPIIQKKKEYRKEVNMKRYTEEITLSTIFYLLVFNNQNVTLMEIFKYFARFEKRKVKI